MITEGVTEVRFIEQTGTMSCHMLLKGRWHTKTFPNDMLVNDIIARIKVRAEDPSLWPGGDPPESMAVVQSDMQASETGNT